MSTSAPLADRLAARIRADGPIPYSAFLDAALYDERDGFYARHGSAGRRGDFLTSVEVGPLFGAVIARALDRWWIDAGSPAPWRVVECGAGRGTLARAVLAAEPACEDALEYVMVERSEQLRAEHPTGDRVRSASSMPGDVVAGVVLANELLDNLAFDVRERVDGAWHDLLVAADAGGDFVEVRGARVAAADPDAADGARVPVQGQAADWLRAALDVATPGRVVVIDYAATTDELARRPWREWMRTYRGHERGGHPLSQPGQQDVTCDVAIDQLAAVRAPDINRSQAEFLAAHGLGALVDQGRQVWAERSHVGDLAALKARSRVREAEALVDPTGLGAFRVLEWANGP